MILNELGIFVNAQTTITYRLIRVLLPTGEVEVLLPTLIDARRFKHGYFSEIYRKRWGIETCFLVKFMLCPEKELKHWLKDFYRQIIQTMEPVRPEKNKERRRRLMRGTERHIYEANYRHAF